jgi:transposase
MIGVDLIGQIRRAFFEQRRAIKEISRELRVSRATVRKVVRSDKTSFNYAREVQPSSKLGEWVGTLTEILEEEAKLPKRERRSTQRLFEELRGRGYDGAHDSVHRFVKEWREERARVPAQAFVPMSFAPGEAYQFDWEPRDDHAPRAAADDQGGAHEAVAQSHAVRAHLLPGDAGAGLRRP